jgi:hypothetical protein
MQIKIVFKLGHKNIWKACTEKPIYLRQKYFGRADFKKTAVQSVIAYSLLKLER